MPLQHRHIPDKQTRDNFDALEQDIEALQLRADALEDDVATLEARFPVGATNAKVTVETVTVTATNTSGTATVVSGAIPLGIYPTSNQDQLVDSVAVSGTTLTVTLAAAATANNVFAVPVLEP